MRPGGVARATVWYAAGLVLCAAAYLGTPSLARAESPGELCLQAIADAEGRPAWLEEGLLRSIAMVESGYVAPGSKRAVPWPWAINSSAGSFYLTSREDAVAKVEELQADGVTNIDVGCLQVNLHYHPNAFDSLEEAFDPDANVAYAVDYLKRLKAQGASVFGAVGRYHSHTRLYGVSYARKVFARWGYGGRLNHLRHGG